ncbi:MAG: MBL fold metallo-hydrolase [Chloroflexota bacterium]
MIELGDIQINLINDGNILVDSGGPFGLVPRALWSRYVEPVQDYLVPNTLICLLIRVDGKNILVDTGYGHENDDRLARIVQLDRSGGDLIAGLARAGLKPEDIDIVINTHLHYDHAGGNIYTDDSGNVHPAFPNAEYVVQRREYEDAVNPNERTRATYIPMNYEPLVETGQMRLLDGDTEIVPGVKGVMTPGHTPGHMSVIVERGDEKAMFVCDLASFAIHFEKLGWMTAYDVEPLVTLETKRIWQQWALEHNALLLFSHDRALPACRLTRQEDGKLKMVSVEVALT